MNILCSLPVILCLCFSTYVANAKPQSVEWAGCGISKKAYMTDLANAYKNKMGMTINLQGGGATLGIRKVESGEVDFGGSCRYSLPNEAMEKSVNFEPVAWDALVVIVHKDNPVNNITIEQVHDLFLGKLTNWNQLGGESKPVKLFIRDGKISGVGYTIRKLIFANNDQDFTASKSFKSTGPLEKAVEEDTSSIAITGISSARLRNVKILKLNDVYPDYTNIKKGAYALYRPLFITYNPDAPNYPVIKDFIKFAHSLTGRSIMKRNGVVPYVEALTLVMKQIRQDEKAQNAGHSTYTYK